MNDHYAVVKKTSFIGMAINFALAVIKVLAGIFGHSSALFADGIHSLSDLGCDALVIIAARYGSEAADDNHPYGHRRIETIATFFIGLFLMGIAVGIAFDAGVHLVKHEALVPDFYTLFVALASIVLNEWLFRYTLKKGEQIDSDLLRANAWHSRGDMLSSLIVLVGLTGAILGFRYLDGIAAIMVAALILQMGIKWCWRSATELTDTALSDDDTRTIKACVMGCSGVINCHQLRTRKMASQVVMDVHVQVQPDLTASEGHYVSEQIRHALVVQSKLADDVTVHIDVELDPDEVPDSLPPSRSELWAALAPQWDAILQDSLWQLQRCDLYYEDMTIRMELHLQTLDPKALNSKSMNQIKQALEALIGQDQRVNQLRVTFALF